MHSSRGFEVEVQHAISLRARLKQATQAQHRGVEQHLQLDRQTWTTNAYLAILKKLWGIYVPLENQLTRIDWQDCGVAMFMERRLAPAMRTCNAVAERLQNVIAHLSTTSQLLNTRVDVAAEATNARLLASMDQRARLQLRLQQTVEGLSVAAISYYALGLIGYVFKAVSEVWIHFDATLATAICAPAVIGLVWWSLQRARVGMMEEDRDITTSKFT